MIKYIVFGVIGLIVLVVLAVGGAAYFIKVDFNNPQTAKGFKSSFASSCVTTFKQRAEKAKVPTTEDQVAKVEAACTCAQDGIIEALAKRPPMSATELASVMAEDPEIKSLTHDCSVKAGIVMP
jgi:hypothetical protein